MCLCATIARLFCLCPSFTHTHTRTVPLQYVVNYTGVKRVSYLGFSQGTAQCFAALATQPRTVARVNSFVALSPAATVRGLWCAACRGCAPHRVCAAGLAPSLLRSLVEANHEFIYLLLGKKAALPYSNSWSEILSVKSFTNVIDVSLKFLFGWTMENVRECVAVPCEPRV